MHVQGMMHVQVTLENLKAVFSELECGGIYLVTYTYIQIMRDAV